MMQTLGFWNILTGLKLKLLPSAERRATMLLAILCLAFIVFPLPARAQQACVPPPQGILAWWPFDETCDPIVAELIGGRVGTFNSPTPAPGEVGNALEFNGTNYVGVGDDPVWSFGPNDFSIELWANFSTPGGGSTTEPSNIFIGHDEGPGFRNKWLFALGGGNLEFHINSPTLGPQFFPLVPFSPAINTWYHLALTRSGVLYSIYVNGVLAGSATNSASIPTAAALLTIGEAENIGFMKGLLDEVTIYNRALTGAEIASIFAAGHSGKCKPSAPIENLQTVIASLPPGAFKNANMQNALLNKLSALLANVETRNYSGALEQLQNDILAKTNGCATVGAPDKNDWIVNCPDQSKVYTRLLDIIAEVKALRR
jgi:hypothetical protein